MYYDEYTLNTCKYMYREQTPPLQRANPTYPTYDPYRYVLEYDGTERLAEPLDASW